MRITLPKINGELLVICVLLFGICWAVPPAVNNAKPPPPPANNAKPPPPAVPVATTPNSNVAANLKQPNSTVAVNGTMTSTAAVINSGQLTSSKSRVISAGLDSLEMLFGATASPPIENATTVNSNTTTTPPSSPVAKKNTKADDDDDDDDDKKEVDHDIVSAMSRLTKSQTNGLIPFSENLLCQTDDQGKYCLLQLLQRVKPILAVTIQSLGQVKTEDLLDHCTMRKVDQCSRILQVMLVNRGKSGLDEPPREAVCARRTDGSYCLPVIAKALQSPAFLLCSMEINMGTCSPYCSQQIRMILDQMGCCTHAAGVLVGYFGRKEGDMFEALSVCPDLAYIDLALHQTCGGLSKLGPSGVASDVTIVIDLPCELLDYGRAEFMKVIRAELAALADAQPEDIVSLRTACSSKTVSFFANDATTSILSLGGELPAEHVLATQVTFRLTAGDMTDELLKIFQRSIKAAGKHLVFSRATAIGRSLISSSPTVGIIGDVKITPNAEISKVLGMAQCDPMLFMDVVASCWSLLQAYMTAPDHNAVWLAKQNCQEDSPCGAALRKFGVENLVHCKPTPVIEGILGLAYLSVMCELNEKGVPCMYYLRENDTVRFCRPLDAKACIANSQCTWHASGMCTQAMTQKYLEEYCGVCQHKLVDVSSTLAPLNSGIPPLTSSALTTVCVRSGNTFCTPLLQEVIGDKEVKMTGNRSQNFCGTTDAARCYRIGVQASIQMKKLESDSCTLHPFLCMNKAEAAMKQDALVDDLMFEGCLKDTSRTQYCIDRVTMLTPELLECYKDVSLTNKCSDKCKALWTKEIQSYGCCMTLMHKHFLVAEKIDSADSTHRGLARLSPCVPTIIAMLAKLNCPELTGVTPVKKSLIFDLPCNFFNEEVKVAFTEKVPRDLSNAVGLALQSIEVTNVSCQKGVPASQNSYGLTGGSLITSNAPLKEPHDFVTVEYTVRAFDVAETNQAAIALDAFVANHGELANLESAISNILGFMFDLNLSKTK